MNTETMLTKKHTLQNSLLILCCFVVANIAMSATSNSGGGKKKDSNKTVLTSLNLKSSSPLSFKNGYQFKGGLSFVNTRPNELVYNNNTVRFQKGNTLYVLPCKPKSIMHRFKTPVKEMR